MWAMPELVTRTKGTRYSTVRYRVTARCTSEAGVRKNQLSLT